MATGTFTVDRDLPMRSSPQEAGALHPMPVYSLPMPNLPKTVVGWVALPVLPMGRHLIVNVGFKEATLAECRAGRVPGLPPHRPDEGELAIRLPNVTVDDGSLTHGVYRLPVDFGPVARAIFDEAGRWHARGQHLLPSHYTFGIREDGAFATPDGSSTPAMLVTKN